MREVAEWIFQAPTPHFRAVLDQTRWPDDARLRVGIHIRWCVDCGYARMTESLVLTVGERKCARARVPHRDSTRARPRARPRTRQNMECILKHLRDLSSKHFGGPNATTAVWLATDNPKQVIPAVRKALAKNYGPAATRLTYPNAEKLGFVQLKPKDTGKEDEALTLTIAKDVSLCFGMRYINLFTRARFGVGRSSNRRDTIQFTNRAPHCNGLKKRS